MIDKLDAELITLLTAEPRLGVFEASRRLGVARGTVQARLERLQRTGVVRDFAPTVDTERLGYPVTAFVTADVATDVAAGDGIPSPTVAERLESIPEVLEVHAVTGPGDLLIRAVARSNGDLQHVIDRIAEDPRIVHTSTVIALATTVEHRTAPLVQVAVTPEDEDEANEEERG